MKKIVLAGKYPEGTLEGFRGRLKGEDAEVAAVDTPEAYDKLNDADAMILRLFKAPKEFIERNPRLKLICRWGVGVDSVDVAFASQRGVAVANTPGANAARHPNPALENSGGSDCFMCRVTSILDTARGPTASLVIDEFPKPAASTHPPPRGAGGISFWSSFATAPAARSNDTRSISHTLPTSAVRYLPARLPFCASSRASVTDVTFTPSTVPDDVL